MKYSSVQFSTKYSNRVQYSGELYITVGRSTVLQYNSMKYSPVQYSTVLYSTVQSTVTEYSAVRGCTVQCCILIPSPVMKDISVLYCAVFCQVLYSAVKHCK